MGKMTVKNSCVVYWLENNLYLNITNQCPNNCYFCLKNFRDGVGCFKLKLQGEPPVREILAEFQNVINKKYWKEIVFCGFGEPLARLDCVLEVSRWVRKNYGKIVTLRIDTNGQGFLLNKGRDVIRELEEAEVDKISISLNAHDEKTYNEICRPSFENAFKSVLEFIEKAKEVFDVEVTALTLPEVNLQKIGEIAEKMGVKFRIREYVPCFW